MNKSEQLVEINKLVKGELINNDLTELLEMALNIGNTTLAKKLVKMGADISMAVNPSNKQCVIDFYIKHGQGEFLLEITPPHEELLKNKIEHRINELGIKQLPLTV